jgi:hypothetical protein
MKNPDAPALRRERLEKVKKGRPSLPPRAHAHASLRSQWSTIDQQARLSAKSATAIVPLIDAANIRAIMVSVVSKAGPRVAVQCGSNFMGEAIKRALTKIDRAGRCPTFAVGAVNLAAGLRDNPERDGQDMDIHPSELFCIQAEDDDGVYLTHRGRRIAKRHFGEPWTILEPGYRRVLAKLKSGGAASRNFAAQAKNESIR